MGNGEWGMGNGEKLRVRIEELLIYLKLVIQKLKPPLAISN